MKLQLIYPLNLPFLISQKWGENPDYYSQLGLKGHNGWDFAVPIGTPVYACHDGTVFFAGSMGDGALQVNIDTDTLFDWKDQQVNFRTMYAHLSEIKVLNGQKVKCGDLIGLSGNTGRYTTGPHLHFGIHPMINYQDTEKGNGFGGAVDPIHFFNGLYPNSGKITVPTVTTPPKSNSALPEHATRLLQALKDFQLQEGIKDFQYEQDLRKLRFGPKTLSALKKYLK